MPGGKGEERKTMATPAHTNEHLLIWWFKPASQDRGQGKGGEQGTKAQHPVSTTVSICSQYASILQLSTISTISTGLLPSYFQITMTSVVSAESLQ